MGFPSWPGSVHGAGVHLFLWQQDVYHGLCIENGIPEGFLLDSISPKPYSHGKGHFAGMRVRLVYACRLQVSCADFLCLLISRLRV